MRPEIHAPVNAIEVLYATARLLDKTSKGVRRELADKIAELAEQGQTQTQIGDKLDHSQQWVSTILAWREAGYPDEMPATVAKRKSREGLTRPSGKETADAQTEQPDETAEQAERMKAAHAANDQPTAEPTAEPKPEPEPTDQQDEEDEEDGETEQPLTVVKIEEVRALLKPVLSFNQVHNDIDPESYGPDECHFNNIEIPDATLSDFDSVNEAINVLEEIRDRITDNEAVINAIGEHHEQREQELAERAYTLREEWKAAFPNRPKGARLTDGQLNKWERDGKPDETKASVVHNFGSGWRVAEAEVQS